MSVYDQSIGQDTFTDYQLSERSQRHDSLFVRCVPKCISLSGGQGAGSASPSLSGRELCQELREELDEARQRLRTQLDANQQLTRQLADVSGRLELAEIRVTQLSGSADGPREAAQSASVAADAARLQAERAAEQARAERDAAAVQFQQYSAALAARLAEAEKQRDALVQQQAVVSAQQAAVPAPVEVAQTSAPPTGDAEREELNLLRDQRQKDAAELEALTQQMRALVSVASGRDIADLRLAS